jgi:hypothetical protein
MLVEHQVYKCWSSHRALFVGVSFWRPDSSHAKKLYYDDDLEYRLKTRLAILKAVSRIIFFATFMVITRISTAVAGRQWWLGEEVYFLKRSISLGRMVQRAVFCWPISKIEFKFLIRLFGIPPSDLRINPSTHEFTEPIALMVGFYGYAFRWISQDSGNLAGYMDLFRRHVSASGK